MALKAAGFRLVLTFCMPALVQVLLEFKEYAQEVDVDFVRKV